MNKAKMTLKIAFYHSLVLSILIFAMIPLYIIIYGSPLHRMFATKVAPEVVGSTGASSYGSIVYGVGYVITDGVAYVDNILSDTVSYFPMYVLAFVSIFVFMKYMQEKCSIFALPIGFALLPLSSFFMIFVSILLGLGGAMGIANFFYDTVVPHYSIPFSIITLCLAIFVTVRNKLATRKREK